MNMQNVIFILIIAALSLSANENRQVELGVKVMFGGRYDDMRMCVATDAGVKGGTIADVMFLTRFPVGDNAKLALEIPVMRPILFAAAFNMLQFEPQVTLEFRKDIDDETALLFGPGVGLSFHYGPDYLSDKENRGESFFAMGPLTSGMIGLERKRENKKAKRVGVRAFYSPLFSGDSELSPGTVVGGVVEGQFDF